MRSSASSAPAPITPIRWLASVRQNRPLSPVTPCGTARHPGPRPALTHVAGARQRVTGAVVAAAGFGTVGSVAAGRASQVTAGGKGPGESHCHPGCSFPQTPSAAGKSGGHFPSLF